jgi:hypothetical protein
MPHPDLVPTQPQAQVLDATVTKTCSQGHHNNTQRELLVLYLESSLMCPAPRSPGGKMITSVVLSMCCAEHMPWGNPKSPQQCPQEPPKIPRSDHHHTQTRCGQPTSTQQPHINPPLALTRCVHAYQIHTPACTHVHAPSSLPDIHAM